MLKAIDIINKARLELADTDKERWKDSELLSLVSDAQSYISLQANNIKNTVSISTLSTKNSYELPANVRLITNVACNSKPLIFVDKEAINKISSTWTMDVGEPQYVIFEDANKGIIKLSPIPEISTQVTISFIAYPDELVDVDDALVLTPDYMLALVYYVVYRALTMDSETRDVSVASNYMALCNQEILRSLKEASRHNLSNLSGFITGYKGFQ